MILWIILPDATELLVGAVGTGFIFALIVALIIWFFKGFDDLDW